MYVRTPGEHVARRVDGVTDVDADHVAVTTAACNFEKAARAQSAALGLPELRLIIYPQPTGIEHEVEGAESARIVTDQLLTMLRDASV